MIYVLTPFRTDFFRSCEMKGLDPRSRDVKWMYRWKQFLGIKIFKTDEVIYGIQFSAFTTKEIESFKIELALRAEK